MSGKIAKRELAPEVLRGLLDSVEDIRSYGSKLRAWHLMVELETDDGESTQVTRERMNWDRAALQGALFNALLDASLPALGILREPVELEVTPDEDEDEDSSG